MKQQWFDVDKIGLGKQAEEQSKGRLIGELIQNALDEAGVTRIDVTLAPVPGRPLADLTVEDDEATSGWCKLAGADPRCSDEAIKHLIRLRFGSNVAAPDPSDTEAMRRFQSQGGTIVAGLSKGEWANVKRAGAVLPAGQICPTAKPYSDDPAAKGVTVVSQEKWTDGMKNIAAYAVFLARELMGVGVVVSVVHTTNNFAACYGGGRLDFNLLRLGHRFFEQGASEDVDRLLIHEFGHETSGDHLSEDYHEALCRLGAGLKKLALEKPEAFQPFHRPGA